MLEPELIFTSGSYMVEPTALALRRMAEINVDLTRGNGLPGVLALHDVPDDPEDVAAQPVLARADNTIMVRKSPKTGKVRIDMRRFILLRRFVIPPRSPGLCANRPQDAPENRRCPGIPLQQGPVCPDRPSADQEEEKRWRSRANQVPSAARAAQGRRSKRVSWKPP
jgi:hypothetical protein